MKYYKKLEETVHAQSFEEGYVENILNVYPFSQDIESIEILHKEHYHNKYIVKVNGQTLCINDGDYIVRKEDGHYLLMMKEQFEREYRR